MRKSRFAIALAVSVIALGAVFYFAEKGTPGSTGWIGFGTGSAAKNCAHRSQSILAALEMRIMDYSDSPWEFRPQTKPGQSNLLAFSRYLKYDLESLRKEGYVEGPDAFTCPGGGLLHISVPFVYCTKHGLLLPSYRRNSPGEYLQAKADSPGIIESGECWSGGEVVSPTVFFWEKSIITLSYHVNSSTSCHICTPLVFWRAPYIQNPGVIPQMLQLVRRGDRVYLSVGRDHEDHPNRPELLVEVTSHPSRERMLELLKPMFGTLRFIRYKGPNRIQGQRK